MVLLVVGNYQTVDFSKLPWTELDGIMWVYCTKNSDLNLKYQLKVRCREYGIPLYLQFAIPPLEIIPTELLKGFGLRISKEVMLYEECINTDNVAKTNQITKACQYVLRTEERANDCGSGDNGTNGI